MNAETRKMTPKDSTAVPKAAPDADAPARPRGGRRRLLMLSLPLALVLGGGAYWLMGGRYVTTDNAYVHQPMVSVSPDVSGRITQVMVAENQHVDPGTPLFRIDDSSYRIALAQAEADLAAARLSVEQLRANYATADARLDAARAILDVQDRELERQQRLTEKGLGSQSALDDATVTARTARNNVSLAEREKAAAAAALAGDPEVATDTLPAVQAALARRDAATRDLAHAEVRAATGGYIAQIGSLNVGQYLNAGTTAATLVEASDTWIEANFKETQLADISVGQPVDIEIDAYPGAVLHGRVDSFGSATGSQFSLIPAQNATGNWVKVVQRVPVRIRLDGADGPVLRNGMSAHVSVDTGHTNLDDLK